MGTITTATVFEHNGALAIDLPDGFVAPDGKVRLVQQEQGMLIVPEATDVGHQAIVQQALDDLRATVREIRQGTAALPSPPMLAPDFAGDELDKMFADIHALTKGEFMPEGRQQPPMPDDVFDFD